MFVTDQFGESEKPPLQHSIIDGSGGLEISLSLCDCSFLLI